MIISLKEIYDLKDQQIAQNTNTNELSKTWKRIRLLAKFKKKMTILKQKLLRSINLQSTGN